MNNRQKMTEQQFRKQTKQRGNFIHAGEEQNPEKFDKLFWSYNCPLQMWHHDDGTWGVVNYMPRKERIATLDERVTKKELPSFCKNAAHILRNLAELFDALADGKIDTIYFPDEKVEDAISERKKELKEVE